MCTHGDCVLHRVESQLGSGQLCFPEHRVWCCFQSYYFPMLPINLPKIIPTSPNLLDYSAHCSSSTRFVLVLMARVGWLPRVSISPANSTWKWWHCFLCHVYSALHCTFHDSTTLLLTWRKRGRVCVCVCMLFLYILQRHGPILLMELSEYMSKWGGWAERGRYRGRCTYTDNTLLSCQGINKWD